MLTVLEMSSRSDSRRIGREVSQSSGPVAVMDVFWYVAHDATFIRQTAGLEKGVSLAAGTCWFELGCRSDSLIASSQSVPMKM